MISDRKNIEGKIMGKIYSLIKNLNHKHVHKRSRKICRTNIVLMILVVLFLFTVNASAASDSPGFSVISPNSGYAGFVYQLSLFGGGFQPGTDVHMSMDSENLSVSDISVLSDISLTFRVTIPISARPGSYDLNITNPMGISEKYKQVFTVMPTPPPNVSSISPQFAMAGSRLPVTIAGEYFKAGGIVTLSRNQIMFTLQNSSISVGRINGTFYFPVDTQAGAWNLTVTNPDGQQGDLSGAITVTMLPPPEAKVITPNQGDMNKPVPVVITGKNFLPDASVSLLRGSTSLSVDNLRVVSNKTLTCVITVPEDMHEGMWDVMVKNPDGQSVTMKDVYLSGSPAAPLSLRITPAWGVQGMKREVNISGMAFMEGDKVFLKRDQTVIQATDVKIISENEIICTIPVPADALTGIYDVVITSRYDKSDTLKSGFTVYSKTSHLLAGIKPATGQQGETISAHLTGYNLPSASTVNLTAEGNTPIPVSIIGNQSESGPEVKFTIPTEALPDFWDLKVKTPDGGELIREHAFRVMYNNTPEIASLQPDRAKRGTKDLKITISGKNFGDNEYVDTILSRNVTNLTLSGATSYHGTLITGYLTIPNNTETGWYNLSVTRNDIAGKAGTKQEMFRVI